MSVLARDGRIHSWIRPTRRVARAVAHFCYLVLTAIAAGLGAPPPPRPFRHEDSIAQVAEDDSTEVNE
jgi:hypothetical protein